MLIKYLTSDPRFFFAVMIAVVVSICLHELSHGVTAILLGDRTPIESGHMTLSPLVHLGPASMICLVLAGIAWGSMPVDRSRLRGKYADALVSAAGPLCNVLLFLLTVTALGLWQRYDPRPSRLLSNTQENGRYLLWVFGFANAQLALFNLIPFPPLDGARIVASLGQSFHRVSQFMAGATPGASLQLMVIFVAAGVILMPVANHAAVAYLEFVRGF